ncbi:hypothetical protein FA95DRAFT_1556285, partial [Auriscalpium vulgare]
MEGSLQTARHHWGLLRIHGRGGGSPLFCWTLLAERRGVADGGRDDDDDCGWWGARKNAFIDDAFSGQDRHSDSARSLSRSHARTTRHTGESHGQLLGGKTSSCSVLWCPGCFGCYCASLAGYLCRRRHVSQATVQLREAPHLDDTALGVPSRRLLLAYDNARLFHSPQRSLRSPL